MASVQLAKVLHGLGTNSVRELFRRTGSPDRSVFKQAQMATIHTFYTRSGGLKGPLGVPLGDIQFTGLTAARRYAGGQIAFQAGEAQGQRRAAVRVRYVGLHCIEESDHDQSTGSDEPYFLIAVVASNGTRLQRFAYDKINSNSVREEAAYIASAGINGGEDNLTPPIVLSVSAIEHDRGSKDEAEAEVRKFLLEVEKKLDKAAQTGGAILGIPMVGNHVMPEWMRDIYVGWLPEWGTALFGLADDPIGKTDTVLFDFKADIEAWQAPPVRGKHGSNDYNVVLNIDGGDEGKYELFFMVDLFDLQATIRPTA